jgi:hypothetical protein
VGSVPSSSASIKTFCWRGVDTDIDIGETSSCACQDEGVGGGKSFAESFVAELSVLPKDGLKNEKWSYLIKFGELTW